MLKLAIVGAGIMGANHARIGAQLRDAVVTHVVDPDPGRAAKLAASVDAVALTDPADLVGVVDAAVVAVPTELHRRVAGPLLDAGIHVLVEKPIAPTTEDADDLIARAAAADVTLMVGHVERYNPAVLELDGLLDRPVHISATRVSPFSPRVTVGVVLDLMIHDIDIVLALAGGEPTRIEAVLSSVRTENEDLASVVMEFDNGVTASLLASRIGQQKIRTLEVTQAENYLSVDLLRQDVTVHRVDHSEYLSDAGARYRQVGVVEIPFLEHRGEPLARELGDFVHACTGREEPRVTGAAGRRALAVAQQVLASADRSS
ncbi:MAG: Gfo/Idh/MocA family oxidoreductase [Actinobacteria bacterium]|nr:Gfo/Idh/MocA family oxidoreductase [Actinomycetota bacterium]